MTSRFKKSGFPVGMVFFALLLDIYKSILLTQGIGAGWQTFVDLLCLDFSLITILLSLAIVHAMIGNAYLKLVLWLILFLISAIYLIDTFVLLALDDHAAIFDIGRYTPEWGVVVSFFDIWAYAAILFFTLSLLLVCVFTRTTRQLSFLLLLSLVAASAFSAFNAPQPLRFYAFLNPLELFGSFGKEQIVVSYSSEQIDFYSGLENRTAQIPKSKPDIILLMMESLSSINSKKASGRRDLLKGFDELADHGVLFPNFFANHQASEGGLIALLSGFPPMHFPTATPYMFDEFALQASVLGEYRQAGYFTEFLTNSDLAFIGLDRYLQGLGIDRARGRDQVPAMRAAPRIVQNAPGDHLLYEEALNRIRQRFELSQPGLMVLATTSTHLPMSHPSDGPDTEEAVWDWSLQQTKQFYQGLLELGFFENGLLLITGDHRQMRPISKEETDRYGDSARARIPLLVIGDGWPRGTKDERFFQQADLLRMLGRLRDSQQPLSPHPIWVERYNRKYGRVERIDKLAVFDENDLGRTEYPLRVLGNQIEWLTEKPVFARSIEIRIHAQRSAHQFWRNGSREPCTPAWSDRQHMASTDTGLELGLFQQQSLNGLMEIDSLTQDRRRRVDHVQSPDLDLSGNLNSLLYIGYLHIPVEGIYRFRVGQNQTACMSLDGKRILDQKAGTTAIHEISMALTQGMHFLDLRFFGNMEQLEPTLEWIRPGSQQWRWRPIPADYFYLMDTEKRNR